MHNLIQAVNDILIPNKLEIGDIDQHGEDTRFAVVDSDSQDVTSEYTIADYGFIDETAMIRVIEPELFPDGVLVEKNEVVLAALILGR